MERLFGGRAAQEVIAGMPGDTEGASFDTLAAVFETASGVGPIRLCEYRTDWRVRGMGDLDSHPTHFSRR